MKRFFALGRAAALALALLPALAGCDQSLPDISVSSMTVQRLSLQSADYIATCQIYNPNSWQMRIEEVRWRLTSGQHELVSGTVTSPTELPAGKVAPMGLSVKLPEGAVREAGLHEQRVFPYHFEGTATCRGPFGPVEIDFANDGRMPVIHPLGIELLGMETVAVTSSKIGLALSARIANTNAIHLTPSKLSGELLINERPLEKIDTDILQAEPLPPDTSRDVRIVIWVRSPEVGVKTLAEMLADPESNVRLVGSMLFRVPGSGDVNDLLAENAAP